ncbi:hypothetical protein MOSE0_C02278 [Monosporozyma servazzii]
MSTASLLSDLHNDSSDSSSSRNNSTVSLNKYHEPSSGEKFSTLQQFQSSDSISIINNSSNFALPPISSFDNLVRAAERQYKTSTTTSTSTSKPNIKHAETVLKPNENANGAKKVTGNKIAKPRRKKQCPICFNYYANLSTHKSTHLTPEDRPHRCSVCNRGFARNNDLIRHQKRHWKEDNTTNNNNNNNLSDHDKLITLHKIKGTFKCPFNSTLIQLDMEIYPYKSRPLQFETSNCHQTGIFSRCDTYKNHLRALHFEYPPGTKKRDRSLTPGRCRNCGSKFLNVDQWLNTHIGGECGYSYH